MDLKTRRLDGEILQFIRRYETAALAPERDFEALALKIFSYQYERNKFYRRFCQIENKNPSNTSSWKQIPAMPTEGFKEFTLSTFPVTGAVRVFRTSGTTQKGRGSGRGAHFFETLKIYKASLLPVFKKYLMPDRARMPMFFLMASPNHLRDSSLSYMMGAVYESFGSRQKNPFFVKNEEVLCTALAQRLSRLKKPAMILATAFSLKIFLDYLQKQNRSIQLPPGSRLMETGGFKGRTRTVSKKILYRQCHKRLGISPFFCVSEYGMTELSSQCYDTTLEDSLSGGRQKSVKRGPAWMRSLVINIRTGREAAVGRRGILRHFDLANRGSVMAVQTGDLAVRRQTGFELLGRAPKTSLRGCSLTYEEMASSPE